MYNYEIVSHPNKLFVGEKCRVLSLSNSMDPIYTVALERVDIWPHDLLVYPSEIQEIVTRTNDD